MNWYKLNPDYSISPVEDILDSETYKNINKSLIVTKVTSLTAVSTVFLGLDQRFIAIDDTRPIVFETLVFSDEIQEEILNRYCTYEEAVAGHWKIVKLVKKRLKIKEIKPKSIKAAMKVR